MPFGTLMVIARMHRESRRCYMILVATAIPFGLIGVIFAFTSHGEPFGFLAMMGVIGLAGAVVNDSQVLVPCLYTIAADVFSVRSPSWWRARITGWKNRPKRARRHEKTRS